MEKKYELLVLFTAIDNWITEKIVSEEYIKEHFKYDDIVDAEWIIDTIENCEEQSAIDQTVARIKELISELKANNE